MEKGFHVSLRGGSHEQNGKPMQDYSSAIKGEGYDIAIVCDGHGADKHFRSHVGSRLATEVVEEKIVEFAEAYPTYAQVIENFGKKSERLKLSIVSAWTQRIKQDYTSEPFTEEELKCGVDSGVDYFSRYNTLVPYGTTILAVLLCKDYYLAIMIGDGAIIRMTPDQDATEETFEGKKLGDHVESMCNQDAAFKIYTKCVRINESEKDLAFVLCSDGFCESEAFTSREIMCNWPKKYIRVLAKYPLEEAREGISKQLRQISDLSSAMDDISIAMAVKDPSTYLSPEQPAEQPVAQPAKQPVAQPAKQPVTQPAKQPVTQPAKQPATQPAKQAVMQPAKQPVAQPAKQPVAQPAKQPVTQPAKQPVTQPATQPAKQAVMQPAKQPVAQPAKQPVTQPAKQPVTQPAKRPVTQPAKQPVTQPAKQPVTQSAKRPVTQPAKQPVTQPAKQPVTQPAKQAVMQPAKQPVAQPAKQPVTQPAKQAVMQPAKQPVAQPAKQSVTVEEAEA